MKKLIFTLIIFASTVYVNAITVQDVHESFLLAKEGFELEAKKHLTESFLYENFDGVFIVDQFVNWSLGRNVEMTNRFNESAFHILKNKRELAKKALTNFFESKSTEVEEFSNSFVDWGLNIMKIARDSQVDY